jgi:hypothetical protein
MDINELKSNWQQANIGTKNRDELRTMLAIQDHPRLTRIRIKFMIEVVLLLVFLATYNNMFDGSEKPIWVHALLIASAIGYVATDILGYLALRNPIQADNLKTSLHTLYQKLHRIHLFSLLSSFFYGVSLLLFFTSSAGDYPPLLVAGMALTFLLLIYLLHRSWASWTDQIKETGAYFEGESNA